MRSESLSEPTLVSDSFLVTVLINERRGERGEGGGDNVGCCRLQSTSTCSSSPGHPHVLVRRNLPPAHSTTASMAPRLCSTLALHHCKLLQSARLRHNPRHNPVYSTQNYMKEPGVANASIIILFGIDHPSMRVPW